ncbi:hypothetical protein [Leptothrix discophora]|uniref:DUF3618 domain-containing protein n=1 Tax=Leptothrix discophora TaxID=89 RepID=A0ABT9G1G6_LEPDI|nr:hypothetical protein [Leptothrix discophora]MDP4300335.1 hypothetical protein [Leptothrix discophora]
MTDATQALTLEQRLDRLEQLHASSAADTAEIRSILEAARGFFRVTGWIGRLVTVVGKLAAAGMAIWAVIYALTHGGRPPAGH